MRLNQSRIYLFANLFFIDYRHQDDETVASRGSISMKRVILRDTEGTRFEIHSIPSRSNHQHSGIQKWFMKANHPVEARRWTQAIAMSIEWYKMREGGDSDASSIIGCGGTKKKSARRKSAESDSSMMRTTTSMHSQSLSGFWKKGSPGNGIIMRDQDSITGDLDMTDASPDLSRDGPSHDGNMDKAGYDEGNDGDDDASSAANSENKSPPHPNIDLQANATAAQLELTIQMVANLTSSTSTIAVPSHLSENFSALLDSLQTTQTLLSEYTSMGQSRDSWYARQLRKERARQDVWEESLRVVVREGENLEQELRRRSRNRGSRVFSTGSTVIGGIGEGKKRPSGLGFITAPVVEEPPSPVLDGEPRPSAISPTPMTLEKQESTPTPVPAALRIPPSPHTTVDSFVGPIPAITIDGDYANFLTKSVAEDEYDHDTDEEDEFFDAIEANALPNMLVHEALTSAKTISDDEAGSKSFANQQEQSLISMKANQGFYAGYAHIRTSLKLSADRPNASLWSVLKHSIGKDLTKISFPVFFNEPTSMLQRMVRSCLLLWVGHPDTFGLVGGYGVFRVLCVVSLYF